MQTDREAILAIYRGEVPGHAVWQPRLYYWYYANRLRNRLPQGYAGPSMLEDYERFIAPHDGDVPSEFRDLTMMEIHRAIGAAPRYASEVLGVPLFEERTKGGGVQVATTHEHPRTTTIIGTPHGTLRSVQRYVVHEEYPVKSAEDLRALRHMLEHTTFRFLPEGFRVCDRAFGDSSPVEAFFTKSPLQRFLIEWAGIENGIYLLYDEPDKVHAFLEFVAEWDDQVYRELCACPIPIFNFGENLHAQFDPPAIYRKYLLPHYQRRTEQLHAAGKFCSIHADGDVKPILPLLAESGFDAIEAPTPTPQGDVTLEELEKALGGRLILQDGIPAVFFLPTFPEEKVLDFARRLLETFWPRLIPGISDKLPPGGDIDRVQRVGEFVRAWRG